MQEVTSATHRGVAALSLNSRRSVLTQEGVFMWDRCLSLAVTKYGNSFLPVALLFRIQPPATMVRQTVVACSRKYRILQRLFTGADFI